jgi:CRISPR/Cas system-associated exonuclease Cas4 (RecB family)
MQLLTGPPGSGKTFSALAVLKAALRRGETSVRLLVPTATMAQHWRNELAREGFVFPPNVIQTISRFIEPYAADLPLVSHALLNMLVEKSVRRLSLAEFQNVAQLAGFHAKLTAVIDECASVGCDPRLLQELSPSDGLGHALARVFEETNRLLEEKKLGMRSTRLLLAASRIAEAGAAPVDVIWLDGFSSFTDPEIALIQSLAKHADVTVTLPSAVVSAGTRARLIEIGFEERILTHERTRPASELFVAPGIEREVDEIARRIVEWTTAGRPLREIGIIVRTPDTYVPLLRATLERFGIPARFYFDSVLMDQAAVRFLAGAVDAMLGGWQHEETLGAMKLSPATGISGPMDRFDFEVRKRLPGAGLAPLRELASRIEAVDRRLWRLLDRLVELDAWRPLRLTPAEWAARLAGLRTLYRPARPHDAMRRETVLEWQTQARALIAFETATAEAAKSFDASTRLSLAEFWPAVKAALRLTPLRFTDQRRDVVHVLSAFEARQWELKVVFLCGMVEGQFPCYQSPDPFLPDRARRYLKERCVRLRTVEDTENEERFLFESALSRATESLVISYPKNDARGDLNLPSLFLDPGLHPNPSRPVRVRPATAAAATVAIPIQSPDLLHILGQKHAEIRPTALESYLQCPFLFFGRHTLKLEGAPPRPEDRLDFRLCGTIVHQVIKEWLESHSPIETVFERIFADLAHKELIVASYRTEVWRARMLADMRSLAAAETWPADQESLLESACRFELEDGVAIRCRLDRLITMSDGRAFVIDYKYSKNLREYAVNESRLQGPLYWLAAERGFQRTVAGVYYCAVRDGVQYAGWGEKPGWLKKAKVEPFAPEWLEAAMKRSMEAARAILAGRVAPAPSDLAKCRTCDFRNACRYAGMEVAIAEDAS